MLKKLKNPEHVRFENLIDDMLQNSDITLIAERNLLSKKWFEYRFYSPSQADRCFLKAYQNIYSRKIAENIDRDLARNARGAHSKTIEHNTRERSQLRAARQRADEFGMPYPVYIEAAFNFALLKSDKRKHFPRPNELHGNSEAAPWFVDYVMKRWHELLADGLFSVEHPAYLIENYKDLPAQNEFRAFIVQHVQHENIPLHRAIRKYTYEKRQIPLDVFKNNFPEALFQQALKIAESDLQHHPVDVERVIPIGKSQLWPTCFALHYTCTPTSPECSSCPLLPGCQKTGDSLVAKAGVKIGIADPAADYEKRLARDRKRRQRERERKNKTASLQNVPQDVII